MNAPLDDSSRQVVAGLQRRFVAATAAMELAWSHYRHDRDNRDFLRRYVRATERCQMLKETMFRVMGARREARMERSAA